MSVKALNWRLLFCGSTIAAMLGVILMSSPSEEASAATSSIEAVSPLPVSSWASGARARRQKAEWLSAKQEEFYNDGIEAGTAAFHLLRPGVDPKRANPTYGPFAPSGGFHWWSVHARYQMVYHPTGSVYDSVRDSCQASYSRLIENGNITAAVVPDTGADYKVVATFDDFAITTLQDVMANRVTHGNGDFTDWFGLKHLSGELPTEMMAVLISEKEAFLPISFTALAQSGATPVSIDVANALDFTTATMIADSLNDS